MTDGLSEPSDLEIRFARPAEADALAGVKVTGWRTTYAGLVEPAVLEPFLDSERQCMAFRALITDPHTVLLVADLKGAVVGFAVGDGTTGYVDSLHVLPRHRGHHVGRSLLRALACELAARGCTELSLHVVTGNTGARRFYERLGGEAVGAAPAPWAPNAVEEVHYRWTDLRRLTEPSSPDAG